MVHISQITELQIRYFKNGYDFDDSCLMAAKSVMMEQTQQLLTALIDEDYHYDNIADKIKSITAIHNYISLSTGAKRKVIGYIGDLEGTD